ncbi:GNAT family N-acetyltransferase [Microbacterium sp. BK668]|uniref:GNAT family N-acetyltransferase n=1 Tax=Microbacterium sp. BK668 TaxID=2512118 RepID=UPI00105D2040|nr:GNAT family N-acetyltransferase [Microbacterium sp. BK668]TDN90562.1 ribosomal protein S18 acetylase RimI-like enzyme [Microbacterium sp. BK668]
MSATPTHPSAPLAERVPVPSELVPPRHPDVVSWRPATEADLDAIMELFRAADAVDHPSWVTPREDVAETFVAEHIDPARDTVIGTDASGRVVAAGEATLHPSRDVHLHAYLAGRVHPELRGRGVGRELMRWEHERARQQIVEAGVELPAAVYVYAEESDTGARHLAQRRGLVEERWFSTMVRDLVEPIPEIPASGAEIVAYAPRYNEPTRLARNDAFRDHWGSLPTPPERWARFIEGELLRPDLSRLAVEGDRVVALALGSVNEEDWAVQGYSSVYIDLIGVVRDRRGRRLAPAVITALLRAAREAGLEKAVLDVDTESPTGANSLYGRLGFEATERAVALVEHF